ncbi:hypothetical protein C731_0015 [Mycolicibacterium hassiacum DSM 44199]|jgi:hypothetical protein|uniref:Uncharacterized protein n=1 Tax=Mycolicibacterium hassiacum (strain DSM 44199 / CIP 105218 / JCM 12690 / 3849) TaxID=1122247 RepID=K5BL40_MYCHD|nr:hypothetical protein [Mycolicibacterium hassiacum]EKF25949.1 hypothetical protein C731_0015 [Mycolicibacterium hassiacum DSM 44199]MBX5488718.1 pullulanase [Mycolicibacterium hassiacum]MDA4088415.1 pullulanase [Mycolicibacterium hassiacum DSM 44199]PZN15656.1 MAG: pullulanase [Mycolicibacterium hassiacum]VCT92512.1 hypothetical protein MHAS_04242 [Mycolicibacterium hassiacum DSM 44199]
MDYCLGDGDGSATVFNAAPDVDLDGDGAADAVGLDIDGDGLVDDALIDRDADGLADLLARDHAGAAAYFTDDGTGTWRVPADPALGPRLAAELRYFGLDGIEHTGGPVVDLDGDGVAGERLVDADGDGLADRAIGAGLAYVDTDGDGRWDLRLLDADGDGRADGAAEVSGSG